MNPFDGARLLLAALLFLVGVGLTLAYGGALP